MTWRRRWLQPLVPVYRGGLALDRWARARRPESTRRLPDPVISVGSLSAGGAGKTPFVLALALALKRREYDVRILSRAYGRKGSATEQVDPQGDAGRYGDEPLLLARQSGVPVFVGRDRYRAGLLAQALPSTARSVNLLDDGFQHHRLERDMDVVLLTLQDIEDELLPAGNLREPLRRLRDADAIVVREDEHEALQRFLRAMARPPDWVPGQESWTPSVWTIRRQLKFESSAETWPERPMAFCGIARPNNFKEMLVQAGLLPVEMIRFPDHHIYTEADIRRILKQAIHHRAGALVTTEKDRVKLTAGAVQQLSDIGPLLVPRLQVQFLEERSVMEHIIRKVSRLNRRRRSNLEQDPTYGTT